MKHFLFLAIVITFFLLHFEGAKVVLFGVPVFLVEIGVVASVVAFLFVRKGRGDTGQWTKGVEWVKWGIFFLFLGVISSTLVALSSHSMCPLSHEGLLRSLGIVKSWFVFPMFFGYILFRASQTYFSREKLISIFLVSFIPVVVLSFLGWLFGSHTTYDGRLTGIFNSPNALAMHLTPAIILSWYFLRKERTNLLTTRYSLLTTLSLLFLLFLTRSVSAWIAVLVAIFFFEYATRNAWVRANNYSPVQYVAIFLTLIGILVFSQWNNPRFEHFFDPDSRSSFASRLMIWQSTGTMIADSPVFGIGPGNFQLCYLAYQKHFPPYLEWSVPEPHNVFLAFWLGSGLIGLCAFCFLLLRWFRTVFRRIQKEGDLLLLSLAVIMIAILVHGLVDTTYWRLGLSYIFWAVFFAGISRKRTGE